MDFSQTHAFTNQYTCFKSYPIRSTGKIGIAPFLVQTYAEVRTARE